MLLIHESLGTLQKVEGTIKAILLKHGIDTVFELKCFDQSEILLYVYDYLGVL